MLTEIEFDQWKWGLFFSIVVGGVVTELILKGLRKYRRVKKEEETGVWGPWIAGFIERGFFTVVVALNLPGTIVAMMAWIGLKMATRSGCSLQRVTE